METLTGPGGIRIELDANQIIPDDPGDGTPRMVYIGNAAGTLDAAIGEKELICGEYYRLTDRQYDWLVSKSDYCDAWLDREFAAKLQQK